MPPEVRGSVLEEVLFCPPLLEEAVMSGGLCPDTFLDGWVVRLGATSVSGRGANQLHSVPNVTVQSSNLGTVR